MRSMKIFLFVLLCSAVVSAQKGKEAFLEESKERRDNIRYDWKCTLELTKTGNYPESSTPFDELTSVNASEWTTVSAAKQYELAHRWNVKSKVAGFIINPNKPGRDNRVVIHLAGSLENPFDNSGAGTLSAALNMSALPSARDVLSQGPFNCHISREIDLKSDLLHRQIGKCPVNSNLRECLTRQGLSQSFQCVAGSVSPVCCYAAFFSSASNRAKGLKVLETVYGPNVTSILQECSQVTQEKNIESECPPPPGTSGQKLDKFYIFNRNASCNPFLFNTQKGCSYQSGNVTLTQPCFGQCLTGLMVNIEISPGSETSEPETIVTILQRSVEFNQKSVKSTSSERDGAKDNSFGYDDIQQKMKDQYKVQILMKRVSPLPVHAGQWNHVWVQWDSRPPVCATSNSGNLTAPVLLVGMEGNAEPVFEIDFACTKFDGDDNNSWRFGWFGADLLLPRISTVWKPNFYAVNSVKNSTFSYAFAGNKRQKIRTLLND